MKKFAMTILAVALITGLAFAQSETCTDACKEACQGACEGGECAGSCPVGAAMDQLPKMTYKVGEETTCCSASAEALAKKHETPILFVVGEKEYTDQAEAMTTLADVTEKFVEKFITPTTCKVSGTTTLAGHKMECSESAGKLAENMKAAMEVVQVSYKVGDESCQCPNQASALAEEKGEKMQYVVGEESTCCSIDARIKIAHAKFRAALDAFVHANQPAEENEEAGSES